MEMKELLAIFIVVSFPMAWMVLTTIIWNALDWLLAD